MAAFQEPTSVEECEIRRQSLVGELRAIEQESIKDSEREANLGMVSSAARRLDRHKRRIAVQDQLRFLKVWLKEHRAKVNDEAAFSAGEIGDRHVSYLRSLRDAVHNLGSYVDALHKKIVELTDENAELTRQLGLLASDASEADSIVY